MRPRVLREASLLLEALLFWLVSHLSRLWGRESSLWVFGARGGDAFVDNAKYLFLHVAAERPEVRPVWVSKDDDVVETLRERGYEAHHASSLRGLSLTLRAGVVCVTHGFRDVAAPFVGGAFLVNLWHGVPLKRIGWDAERAERPLPARLGHSFLDGQVDLLTAPGDGVVDAFTSGLRVDEDRIAVTGYPRNDALVRDVPGMEIGTGSGTIERVQRLSESGRVVFYLPTYRGSSDEGLDDHVDFTALDDFFAERDAFLVVKPHPNEHLDGVGEAHSRIVRLPPAVDVYPLLAHADVLLTDYSSILFDFLLLDRPIVFYPYDLEAYRARREFYFPYDEVTPGPVARDFEGLLAAVDEVLEADEYEEERASVRERFFAHDPGRAAARVVERVMGRIGR